MEKYQFISGKRSIVKMSLDNNVDVKRINQVSVSDFLFGLVTTPFVFDVMVDEAITSSSSSNMHLQHQVFLQFHDCGMMNKIYSFLNREKFLI
jgi:hypothetical protein